MIALLRRLLPVPHGDMFFVGAITYVVSGAVWMWTWTGLALHADNLEPAIARTVLDVSVFFGPILTGATTTMMAPVVWLALRGEAALLYWLGLLGALAFAEQAIETITIFGATGFTRWGHEFAARRWAYPGLDTVFRRVGRRPRATSHRLVREWSFDAVFFLR
jgi:hypothetical protein